MDLNRLLKLKEALEDFMENLEIDGVCGFWTTLDEENLNQPDKEFTGSELAVYLVLDTKKRNFEGRGNVRNNVRAMIKDYLNLDVYVGSIGKNCD